MDNKIITRPMWVWKVQDHTEYANYNRKCPYLEGSIQFIAGEKSWSYRCRRCSSSMWDFGHLASDAPVREVRKDFRNGSSHVKLLCGVCKGHLGWKNPDLFK